MTLQDQITEAVTEARFPLSALTLSPLNPRQQVSEDEIAELAASIMATTLIQNIAGLADGKGGAEIVAGGRRLRALQYLAAQHPDLDAIRPDLANPMVRLAPDATTAQAWATMENIARRDLHPAEEIRAYAKMAEAAATVPVIARAFAVTEPHVHRRLALASLHPEILDALARDEISLSTAAAFTVADDEDLALDVLDRVRGQSVSADRVRQMLKPAAIRESDRRAVFVGIADYEVQGGRVTRDLFTETVTFDDAALLETAFVAKLAEATEAVIAEGWKWAVAIPESYIGWGEIESRNCARIYAEEGALSEDEAARYDELAELAEDGALDPEGEAELAALEAITEGAYGPEQMALAGVLVYVNSKGELARSDGMVAPEDKEAAIAAGILQASRHASAEPASKSPISVKLADDLKRVATGARQHAALRNPDLILALAAFQISGRMGYRKALGLSMDEVGNLPSTEAVGYALDPRLTTPANGPKDPWESDLAKGFAAFRQKGPDFVMGELVRHLAAQIAIGDAKLGAMVDKAVSADIREVWTPTAANFFSRVGGAYLEDLWRDLLGLKPDHPTATTFAKLKKGEKAARLEALFSDPDTRAALGLTEAERARIDGWLPEIIA